MFFCPSHSAMRGPTPLTYLTGVVRSNIYVASLQTARAIRPAPDPSAPDARRSARPGLAARHAKIARVGGPGLAAINQIITDGLTAENAGPMTVMPGIHFPQEVLRSVTDVNFQRRQESPL